MNCAAAGTTAAREKGCGRFILNSIEEDARKSGAKGVAAWGLDIPDWNPVSFYEHMGYARVDKRGCDVLVWKPFVEDAQPPALVRPKRTPPRGTAKRKVTAFVNGWCGGGCELCVRAREAVAGIEERVTYEEIDTSDKANLLAWGIEDAVFLDDARFGDSPFWSSEELRKTILELHGKRP